MAAVLDDLPDLRRPQMRRNIWCEGCGLGNMQQSISIGLMKQVGARIGADCLDAAGFEAIKNNIAMVSGIGCTSRMAGHLGGNSVHTTHCTSLALRSGVHVA